MWPEAIIILASSSSPPDCASTFLASSIALGHSPLNAISTMRARLLANLTIASSSPIDRFWNRIRPSRSLFRADSSTKSNIQLPPPLIIAPSRLWSGFKSNFKFLSELNLEIERTQVKRKIVWPTAMNIQVTRRRYSSSKPLFSNQSMNGIKSPNSL